MLSIFIFFFHITLVLTGFLKYEIWDQITYIANMQELDAGIELLVHLPRFMIVYPAIYLSDFFNVEQTITYGLYISVLGLVAHKFMFSTGKFYRLSAWENEFLSLTPLAIAFVANGRIVFGLAGLACIIFMLHKVIYEGIFVKRLLMVFLGLIYSSVSSGIFSVALMFCFFYLLKRGGNIIKKMPFRVKMIGMLILSSLIFFFIIFLHKNISFYEEQGGAIDILSHGLGMLVNPEPLLRQCTEIEVETWICKVALVVNDLPLGWFSVFFIISTVVGALIAYLIFSKHVYAFKAMVLLSLLGGVFGFTTMFSFLSVANLVNAKEKLNLVN